MPPTDIKNLLQSSLHAFGGKALADAARSLLGTLGYRSERRIDLTPNTAGAVLATFAPPGRLDRARPLRGPSLSAQPPSIHS